MHGQPDEDNPFSNASYTMNAGKETSMHCNYSHFPIWLLAISDTSLTSMFFLFGD
jgi:hypothetical protein